MASGGGEWSFAGGVRANPELCARYEILERIGEGTYGEVFRGKRKADGLNVALKETRDPQCSTREAEALLALDHPNVVKMIEYFVQDSNLILVLEYLPSDLNRIIQASDRRSREAEVKSWMVQLLRGVAACHRASIIHRDLKPSNLLVGGDGTLKIADFGQARGILPQSVAPSGHGDIPLLANEKKRSYDLEKETINAWIDGTSVVKPNLDAPEKAKQSGTKDGMASTNEGCRGLGGETIDKECCRCFCLESDNHEAHDRSEDQSNRKVIGCRSVNCTRVTGGALIVSRSNHFVNLEQKVATEECAKEEELGRREWVLAEKNSGKAGAQEKDSDFFNKLRSFIKRRGRLLHKQAKSPSRIDISDIESIRYLSYEGDSVSDPLTPDYTTTILQHSLHETSSAPGCCTFEVRERHSASGFSHVTRMYKNQETWTERVCFKGAEVAKKDEDYMDEVGIRPLLGNESTEEEILLKALDKTSSSILERSSKRSTFDLKETVQAASYHPVTENPFHGMVESFGDSGRLIMNSTSHGYGGRDDMGSESKRRKAYELETGREEHMFTEQGSFGREEVGTEASTGILSLENQDAPVDMETDTGVSEFEAVRGRILHGKHRKINSQKREGPPLRTVESVSSTGQNELATEVQVPKVDKEGAIAEGKSKDSTEVTENAVRVLGLERVHNGVEGYTREVECAQEEGTVPSGPENEDWEGTVCFWDGAQQKWESADEASDGENKGNEEWNHAKWYDGAKGQNGNGVNGYYYGDGSTVIDGDLGCGYDETANENSDQEDGNPVAQTGWFRPPDVRDSYVKGKLEVFDEGNSNEDAAQDSREFGHLDHERLHEIEVHSQQEENESTYSGESERRGSELSPFVGTQWYKAPELLYGATKYGKGLDMWAVGCIFAELLGGEPLFPGICDIDQLSRIARVLGAPNEKIWPGCSKLADFDKITFSDERPLPSFQTLIPRASPSAVRFLEKFLVYDPEQRLTAEAALRDIYFVEEPLPALPHDLEVPSFRRDSSASEEWGTWRDPGSPFSDFEILDSAP